MVTSLKELEIPVADLELGMHVVRLDRPWIETDFLLQGFVIQNKADIEALQRQCKFVFIEAKVETIPQARPERRKESKGLFARVTKKASKPVSVANQDLKKQKPASSRPPSASERITYIKKINTEKEMPAAQEAYAFAKTTVKDILNGIRLGRTIDLNQARTTVNGVVDSLLRNKDALTWLTRIKNKDEYTAEHSLNVCILSATFARHLGHDEAEIRAIALCGLLHDVGKSKVPDEVLNKEGRFTDEELEVMKLHPVFGRDLLMSLQGTDHMAIDVAHSHHERIDGKGYPRGLSEHQIPYYAKVVAITDCYDAITSNRCYDKARASMEALDIIYRCKGTQLDEELAVAFIKCISIYPPGAIVELTNDQVGIILSTYEENRLRPRILLVLNEDKSPRQQRIVDLSKNELDEAGNPLKIKRELPNGTYGVDLRDFLKKGLVLGDQEDDDIPVLEDSQREH